MATSASSATAPSDQVQHDLAQLGRAAGVIAIRMAAVRGVVDFLQGELKTMAASQADLIAKISELGSDVTSYEAREQAVVDALNKTISDLQASGDQTAAISAIQQIIDSIPSDVPPSTAPAASTSSTSSTSSADSTGTAGSTGSASSGS